MSDWRITEEQLLELNVFLQRVDDVEIHNCLTRTAQETKLFPIMPYLMMCFFDAYYRFPTLIREASAVVSPEEMGHRAREATCNLSKLTAWGTLNFYLNGRTTLLKMGLLRPQDNLEDLWFMCDWWRRFSSAYHRNGGHTWTLDAWDIAQEHDERTLQVLEADAFEADEALRAAAARFVATGTQYSFLVHCESRVGLSSSGPYRLSDRHLLHTRDFMNLSECDFSWLDGVAANVAYNNLTLSIVTEDVAIEITDWGTAYAFPEAYQDRIVGVGLYTSDFLTDRYLPVGMGSRAELTRTLQELTAQLLDATRRLYRRFAEMTFDQLLEAGIYTYFQAAADISHMAGTYRQEDWETVDIRGRRFWPIFNEEYALDAYVDHFAAMLGEQASQNDYYLHPVSYGVWRRSGRQGPLPQPGRNANFVPAHVLIDHDYPLRALPNGRADFSGTSSLPKKAGGYTFACGRLTQDEMNERARTFRSPLLEQPWRYIDEQWVKWNYEDPEVDALDRYAQEHSRLLHGRGSTLVRKDIDAIRRAAGERPWSEVTVASRAGGAGAVTNVAADTEADADGVVADGG